MKKWTVSLFGRRVLEVRVQEEASLSEVVQSMVAQRLADGVGVEVIETDENGMIACECCGDMFDPTEADDGVDSRFADMTERIVWDSRIPDEEEE
jgi:hypothetical protein